MRSQQTHMGTCDECLSLFPSNPNTGPQGSLSLRHPSFSHHGPGCHHRVLLRGRGPGAAGVRHHACESAGRIKVAGSTNSFTYLYMHKSILNSRSLHRCRRTWTLSHGIAHLSPALVCDASFYPQPLFLTPCESIQQHSPSHIHSCSATGATCQHTLSTCSNIPLSFLSAGAAEDGTEVAGVCLSVCLLIINSEA